MGFKFPYQDEKQIESTRFRLLAEGVADFMIEAVRDTDDRGYPLTDSKNNPKLELDLIVKDRNGVKTKIKENLSGAVNVVWKIKQLLECVGLGEAYNESGEFEPSWLVGRRGKCQIYTRRYTNRDGRPGEASNIKEFIVPGDSSAPAQQYQQPVQYQSVMPSPHVKQPAVTQLPPSQALNQLPRSQPVPPQGAMNPPFVNSPASFPPAPPVTAYENIANNYPGLDEEPF